MPLVRPTLCAMRCVTAFVVGALLSAGLASTVTAQKSPSPGGTTQSQKSQTGSTSTTLSGRSAVTFDKLFAAVQNQDFTMVQIRRFFGDQGQVVSVREEIKVDADGTESPPFAISFLGVIGELPGSPTDTKWQQTYARYGRLFHEQGSFRVRNLAKSLLNYTLHDFGSSVRAGRPVHRVVVFPQVLDKSIWVVDVDEATYVPLYAVEFDCQFRLLSEVEAESFLDSVQLPTQTPAAGVTGSSSAVHADFAAAMSAMGNPAGLVEPSANFTGEYQIDQIETRVDPLNGQQKVVISYTDGVDQFFIVETPGVNDVFASLFPVVSGQPSTGNTIARYRDPCMSALLFWEGSVAFHVIGRGSLQRLDGFARHLYLQALSTN